MTEPFKAKTKYSANEFDYYAVRVPQILAENDPRAHEFLQDFSADMTRMLTESEQYIIRLKEKTRRYRLQLKQLNRAHVVLKRNYERMKAQHDSGPSGPDYELPVLGAGLSPPRPTIDDLRAERLALSRSHSSIEY